MDNFLGMSLMVSIRIIFLKWFMHVYLDDALVHSLNNPLVQRYRIWLRIHWGALIDHGSIKRILLLYRQF